MSHRRCITFAIAAAVCAACRPAATSPGSAFQPADEVAIRALDSAYVAAWLRDDTSGVLATFDTAAMIVPPGHEPVTGHERIRAWWWPSGAPRTMLTKFESAVEEIGGVGDLAFMRTRSTVSWITAGSRTPQQNTNLAMTVLRRGTDGRWRIYRHAWGPPLGS